MAREIITAENQFKLVFDWYEVSKDIAKNTTDVSWTLDFVAFGSGVGYVNVYLPWVKVSAQGVNLLNKTLTNADGRVTSTEKTINIGSGTITIQHNSDGTGGINWLIEAEGYGTHPGAKNIYEQFTVSLEKIDRIAQITSVKEFNDETNPVLSYYNPTKEKNLSLMIDVEDKYGDLHSVVTKTIAAGVESGEYTVSFTTAQRNTIREYSKDTKSANLRFRLYSTAGYKDSTYSCPIINADPTFTFSVVDTDSETIRLTGNSNKIIKGYSNPKVTVSASGKKYATISAIGVFCGNDSHTVTNLSSFNHTFTDVALDKLYITVVDSRGKRNVLDTTFGDNIIDYTPLGCVLEVDSVDFTNDETVTTKFKVSGPYFNQSFGSSPNSLRASYRYKLGTNDWVDWISFTPTKTTKSYSATISVQSAYTDAVEIEVNISDALVSQIQSYKNIATPVFDWGEDDFNFNVPVTVKGELNVAGKADIGGSITAGGHADIGGYLKVGGYTQLDGTVLVRNCYPVLLVDYGISNGWRYRKYSDGTAECWCGLTYSNVAITSVWGGIYTSANIALSDFPIKFYETPVCRVDLNGGYAGGWIVRSGSNSTPTSTTNPGSFQIARGSSYSGGTYYVTVYAKGRWSTSVDDDGQLE